LSLPLFSPALLCGRTEWLRSQAGARAACHRPGRLPVIPSDRSDEEELRAA